MQDRAKTTVGFIGLGYMGEGMAANLLAKGNALIVMANRKRDAVERLVADGASEVKSAAEMASRCDAIFLCVTGSPEVEAIIEGPDGILAGGKPGLMVIDCSTAEPDSTLRLAEVLAKKGMSLVDAPLGRSPTNRQRMAIVKQGGKEAITHYTVEESYGTAGAPIASLVDLRLETGRTHQIRVHMAALGHPLIGDPDYGKGFQTKVQRLPEPLRDEVSTFERQALHAWLLGFEHPLTGETLRFESEPPEDLAELIEGFKAL